MKSEEEAWYRLSLARGRLRRAVEAFERRDYLGCILEAQLSVENAAKAVIAVFRIPSWSHDPSVELREVIARNRENYWEAWGGVYERARGAGFDG